MTRGKFVETVANLIVLLAYVFAIALVSYFVLPDWMERFVVPYFMGVASMITLSVVALFFEYRDSNQ